MPTAIHEIHGVKQDEVRQRSAQVNTKSYMPYLSLTSGEFKLANYLEQAKMLWQYTQNPVYGQAVKMLENALYGGVHNGVNFVGSIPNELQTVARAISTAKHDTRPASGSILLERTGMKRPKGLASGVRIGDNIIPGDPDLENCNEYAINYVSRYYRNLSHAQIVARIAVPLLNQNLIKKYNEGKAECKTKRDIENILNQGITLFGHHTLYGFLPNGGNSFPSSITTKRILQGAAHQDLSRIANTSQNNMNLWLNTAIMRKNAENKIGPLDQLQTNISWTGLPADGINEFLAWYQVKSKADKFGFTDSVVAGKILELIKKYGQPNISAIDPATAKLIWKTVETIFVALIAAAPAIISALLNKRADAFAGAKGIGTQAFGPEAPDWTSAPGGGSSNTLILLGAAAASIYFLTQE